MVPANRIPFFSVLVWLALIAAPAWAASPLVEEILLKAGAVEQLAHISRSAQITYEKAVDEQTMSEEQAPRKMRERIKRLIGEAFAADKLQESVGKEIEAKLTTAELQAILKWLSSPLIQRCTQLEIAASSPEASAEIEVYTAQLKRSPVSARRMQLARQFDVAQRATQSTATLILGMQLASASAIVAMLPTEQGVDFAKLVKAADKQRPAIEKQLRPLVTAQILYTYQSLNNEELSRYIKEIKAGPGKKLYSVSQTAYEKALIEASARSSRSILEAVRNAGRKTDA